MNLQVVYVMWLREMKRFLRAKSRIIGSLGIPFFFLLFLGAGFRNMSLPGIPEGLNYVVFLAPGIIGMVMLFAGMFAGISVLWDRQFGFLKEIMVAPVKRVFIVLGRIAGSVSTTIIQGLIVMVIAVLMGLAVPSILGFIIALVFMVLISTAFVSVGLAFATKMRDMHGFQLIMNFLVMPLFLLSGALFPLAGLPSWIAALSYLDPLTYGVDGLRGALIGTSHLPLWINFIVLLGFCLAMVALGTYLFRKSEMEN